MSDNDRPAPALVSLEGRLLLVKTYVFTCPSCKVWVDRRPQWHYDDFGKGYSCHRCGATGVQMREGRPFGPKSMHWSDLKDEWHDIKDQEWKTTDTMYLEWLRSTVVLDGEA